MKESQTKVPLSQRDVNTLSIGLRLRCKVGEGLGYNKRKQNKVKSWLIQKTEIRLTYYNNTKNLT